MAGSLRAPLLRLTLLAACAALPLLSTGCVFLFYDTDPPATDPPPDSGAVVTGALRAHLLDGGVVLFRDGARVSPDTIAGRGWRYGFTRTDSARVDGVAMDSVAGLEAAPESHVDVPTTLLVSVAATALGTVGTAALAVAIFGSCPTVYASDGGGEVLEAELFSYSIAPLLEGRDVDALGVRASPSGVVRLDVRNEALETHRLNHIRLLELRHDAAERALPDGSGLPVAVAGLAAPGAARDRDGRDVAAALAEADGVAFETSAERLAAAADADLEDWIELVFPRPSPGEGGGEPDSVALVLRLRNSLLNTVLFYDLMLAPRGADAVSWLASDLARIGPAVELGGWWASRMGLRVEVRRDGAWTEAARLPDTGPIAWTEVAVPVALARAGDSVRVRLRFVADEWRVDRAALAASVRRPATAVHEPARVLDPDDAPVPGGKAALAAPDERYLETRPGDRFVLEFDAGPEPETGTRSFLLSSQGYYSEWIRPAWVREAFAAAGEPPEPGDGMLRAAMRRWAARRPDFERAFFDSRIPTR